MSGGGDDEWYDKVYLKNPGPGETKMNSTWRDVIDDITDREAFGVLKYGKYLTKNTNEDMLNHLYEELLDAVVYIRTLINQRKDNE